MNLSSRTAAGRSRSADGEFFSLKNVVHRTGTDRSDPSPASPHAWKRGLQEKIWSPRGPKGLAARSVLSLLLWHADANGRVWLGIQAIANKTGAGSLRTVRSALDSLARQGWLQSTSQTWATLTAEQTAAGRPVPRRGDVGRAPNLYVLLDAPRLAPSPGLDIWNSGSPKTPGASSPGSSPGSEKNPAAHPGLVRAAVTIASVPKPAPSPLQKSQEGPEQKCPGEPLADLHHDLDPKGSRSKIASVERIGVWSAGPRRRPEAQDVQPGPSTHRFSKIREKNLTWLDAWNVIVATHTDKTQATYGLPPLPPDLKRSEQQALAECLDAAALDVHAKLHARTGLERDMKDVRHELATRVMQLYFKRDNEFLRRVKHALRDLPREFHARITEAMQQMLRENHDAQMPRQTRPETRFVETTKPTERSSPPQPPHAAQVITAREARRLLEALGAASHREEPKDQPEPFLLAGQDKLAPSRSSAGRRCRF